jgi:hypothetical protein
MFRFDTVLVAPSREHLEHTLVQAAAAANKGCRARKVAWTAAETDALLREQAGSREGDRQWNGPGEQKQKVWPGTTRSALGIVWWTDHIQRIHYRIAADRVCYAAGSADLLVPPYQQRPFLSLIYPEEIYLRQEPGEWKLFAVCSCGAAGPPEAIAWMGPHCGTCHDRTEAGDRVPIMPGAPARWSLTGHKGWIERMTFTPDGRTLLYQDRHADGAYIWDLKTGARSVSMQGARPVNRLAVSMDGKTIAIGRRGLVELWSIGAPEAHQTFELRHGRFGPVDILGLELSPDGSVLALMAHDRVELWDVVAGRCLKELVFNFSPARPSRNLAFSPDGAPLAIVFPIGGLRLWNMAAAEAQELYVWEFRTAHSIAFSPDGRTLGLAADYHDRRAVGLWDMQTSRVRARVAARRANDLVISPDGRIVAVACEDGGVRFAATDDGRALGAYRWHTHSTSVLAFSPDGRWLATAGSGYVKIWPVEAFISAGAAVGQPKSNAGSAPPL